MPRFEYHALDAQDKPVQGLLEARDRDAALEQLAATYPVVVRLRRVKAGWADRVRGVLPVRVSTDHLLVVTQQLAAVLNAGLPLKQSLEFVVGDAGNPALRNALEQVSTSIHAGSSLGEGMAAQPDVFPSFYVSMVKAGEKAGNLPVTLERVAGYLQKSSELQGRVQAAFYYPAVVLAFSALLTTAILVFGMPMVRELYAGMGRDLPLPTQLLLDASNGLIKYSVFWFLIVPLLLALLWRWLKGPGALLRDRFLLRLPVLGPLLQNLAVARFARNFGSVYQSGVPVLEALELSAPTVGNRVFEHQIETLIGQVSEGLSLTQGLRAGGFVPALGLGMLNAGEASGTLDKMLERVGDYYEARVDGTLRGLTSMVEPLLMIVVGVFLGALILCVGMPFLNLSSAL
jgi:type IV pilus assembly protein PilC